MHASERKRRKFTIVIKNCLGVCFSSPLYLIQLEPITWKHKTGKRQTKKRGKTRGKKKMEFFSPLDPCELVVCLKIYFLFILCFILDWFLLFLSLSTFTFNFKFELCVVSVFKLFLKWKTFPSINFFEQHLLRCVLNVNAFFFLVREMYYK